MGRELDSLADVISFGVAPAGIAFAAGLDRAVDQLVLMYFVGCGVSRLARYNVTAADLSRETGKVTLLRGHADPDQRRPPGPADAGLPLPDASTRCACSALELHLVTLLFLLSGSLMISKTLRIPKP